MARARPLIPVLAISFISLPRLSLTLLFLLCPNLVLALRTRLSVRVRVAFIPFFTFLMPLLVAFAPPLISLNSRTESGGLVQVWVWRAFRFLMPLLVVIMRSKAVVIEPG